MGIEVRQLVIHCHVVLPPPPPLPASAAQDELRALKEQLLAECRRWLRDAVQRNQER